MGFEYTNSKQKIYFLHKKRGQGTFYFFCSTIKEEHEQVNMPKEYEIVENFRTAFPMLRRKK